MKRLIYLLAPLSLATGCSETNMDDLNEDELTEIEAEVEVNAKTLEEAADEAVKVLEQDIETELDEDNFGVPTESPSPDEAGQEEVQ